MTKEEARFHLIMKISRHSQRAANRFGRLFEHTARERSSHKAEMKEINEFWNRELSDIDPVVAKRALELPVDRSIDIWLRAFETELMKTVVEKWA